MREKAIERLATTDARMVDQYSPPGEVYHFDPGDEIWLRQRKYGKRRPKSIGPFKFVRYVGSQSKSAVINTGTKEITVSCIHLAPYL